MKTIRDFFKRSRNDENADTLKKSGKGQKAFYQCPMQCEGDKLYDSPGICPVCNMKLVPVNPNGSNSQDHEHHGHSHRGCC